MKNNKIKMKNNKMKKLIGAVLFACVCVGLVLARPAEAPSESPSVADTLKQLEQDFGDAIKAVDANKLNQILADDWVNLGGGGRILTKEGFLRDLKSGNDKLESFELGPMDVKVLGNVAVVQGSATEKRTTGGQDSSGESVWMDVFVKSGDKWVIVRSHSAKVK
jgi:ketosteroid isomerase-like protein